MLANIKKWFKNTCRIVVAIIVGIIAYVIVRAGIECPDQLAIMAGTLVAVVGMMWYFFKALTPKAISSGMRKGSKKVGKKFWKFIF